MTPGHSRQCAGTESKPVVYYILSYGGAWVGTIMPHALDKRVGGAAVKIRGITRIREDDGFG